MSDTIDRNKFVPPYYQLAQILEQKILSGELRLGEPLPSETELGKTYKLSRMTVRKCLNLLAEKGLVDAQQGRGTFISRPALDRAGFIVDEFHKEMSRRSLVPDAKLIAVNVSKPTSEIAEKLAVKQEDRVLSFSRLLLADNTPIAVERKYLRFNKGRPILENELQYRAFSEIILAHTEVLPVQSRMLMRAEAADETNARYLQVPVGSPLLCLEQFLYTKVGEPVGWGLFYYCGDRFTLVSEVVPLKGVE